ncbi:YitT family protein, partial [bacterium]|nr:YitT family protein [bacterium]
MTTTIDKKRFKQDLEYLVLSIKGWNFWKTILLMFIGSVMISVTVHGLLIPNKFFDGGVNGISLVIFYLTGWPPLGVIYLLLNIPIFLVCWREMSLKFVVVSSIGVVLFSSALYLFRGVTISVKDPIMAAILAGVIAGTGVGIYLRVGGSCGGLDMVAIV